MSGKIYSDKELASFAERILLKERSREDFDFLDESQMEKLEFYLEQGFGAGPIERSEDHPARSHQSAMDCPEGQERRTSFGLVERKIEMQRIPLLKRLSFKMFPIELLLDEEPIIRRQLLEALVRRLTTREIAILLLTVDSENCEEFLREASTTLAADIREDMELGIENVSDIEVEGIIATYSAAVVSLLLDSNEISPELQKESHRYLSRLRKDLESYCQNVVKGFGIPQLLEKLSESQWRRLTGLTSRRDMALMSYSLPASTFIRLTDPLPVKQKTDVQELISFYERAREEDVGSFADILVSLRKFRKLIKNILSDVG